MSRGVQEIVREKPFGTRYGYEYFDKTTVVHEGVERIRYTGVRFCPCGRILQWDGWVYWNLNFPVEKACCRCGNRDYRRMWKQQEVFHEWIRKPEVRVEELAGQELHLVLPCTRVTMDAGTMELDTLTGEVRVVFVPRARKAFVLDVTGRELPDLPSVVFSHEKAREYGFDTGGKEYVSINQTIYKPTIVRIGRIFQRLTGDEFFPDGGLSMKVVVRLLEAVTLYPHLTTLSKSLGWSFLKDAILVLLR